MRFIVHKRYKGNTVSGYMNIPANTEIEERDGIIYYKEKAVCAAKSQVSIMHFCRNNDRNGMERGKLTQKIIVTLEGKPGEGKASYQKRWNKVWNDPICQKYKRIDFVDYWMWDYSFFQAPIKDLKYISHLVSV